MRQWRSPSGTAGPLSERPFRRYYAATVVNLVGSTAGDIALAFAVLGRGSVSDLGLVFFARETAVVGLLLAGGVLGDRRDRRRILAGGCFVQAVAQAALAITVAVGASTATVALFAVVSGGGQAFVRPALTGFLPEVVSPENLRRANGLMGSVWGMTAMLGAAGGASVVSLAGPVAALAIDAVSFVVAGVLIAGIQRRALSRQPSASPFEDLRAGWREFTSRSWVWIMVLNFGFFQLFYFPALLVLGPFVAKTEFGGAAAWGAILTAHAAGALAGSAVSARIPSRYPLRTHQVLSLPQGIVLIALGVGAPLWALIVFGAVSGASVGASLPFWFSTLQRLVPERALSRISSFDELGSVVLNPIGYVLIGPVAAATTTGAVLTATGVATAGVVLAALATPSVWALRWPGDADDARAPDRPA